MLWGSHALCFNKRLGFVAGKSKRCNLDRFIICLAFSLVGPFFGRTALGWFVDMSAIGASIGFMFTCMSTIVTMKRNNDKSPFLRWMAVLGATFSLTFIVLQLVPIPGLEGVHFGGESYVLLVVWIVLGIMFYIHQVDEINAA